MDDFVFRPLRLYRDYYRNKVMPFVDYVNIKGGKRLIVKNKSQADINKSDLKVKIKPISEEQKIKSKIDLDKRLKLSNIREGIKLKALDKEIKNIQDEDFGIEKKTIDTKERVDKIKARIEKGEFVSEKDLKLLPILTSEVSLLDDTQKRKDLKDYIDKEIFEKNGFFIINNNFPYSLWTGPNNSSKEKLDKTLGRFVIALMRATPETVHDIAYWFSNVNLPNNLKMTQPEIDEKFDSTTIREESKDPDTENLRKKLYRKMFGTRVGFTSWLSIIANALTPTMLNKFSERGFRGFPTIKVNEPSQLGYGANMPALYNDEIDEFFSDIKKYPNFAGTIASDEIPNLPKKLPIGFVMNLDKSNEPGSHWVAVYIDNKSVEYFDPLADPPTKEIMNDLKKYVESLNLPYMLKFKINKVKQQNDKSNHCGYFSIKFLDDRFHGIPYDWTTRFINNSRNGEKELVKEFDYI